MTLWGGRFSTSIDDNLRALNDSIHFDKRMYAQDIAGSIAYARAIASAGVITPLEAEQIVDGLFRVKAEFDDGRFEFKAGDEDIHTAVERRLTELVGDVGGKLHTGRSRNDQVATDFRLWVMAAIEHMDRLLQGVQDAFLGLAQEHIKTIMPGYTHMQPAQPITVAHWLMSFFWMLARDRERLSDSWRRTAVMPLGSGALSGTPFEIDRDHLAKELGFQMYTQNSLDAVSDRDFVAETLFALALTASHLSRFAEDVIIYSNPLFGFVALDERYSTGSSLMPQKRNADALELTRGKAGRLAGHVSAILNTLKGLPSGYNKDLQEDKEALFDSVDTFTILLPVLTAIIQTLTIDTRKLRAALTDEMLATDLADYLVARGMPFRKAHSVVGHVVKVAAERGQPLAKMPIDKLKEFSSLFEDDVAAVFDFEKAVARRRTAGGTAPDAVREQIQQAKAWLLSQQA